MKCSVEICSKNAIAKGFCDGHYRRFKKRGHPGNSEIPKMERTTLEKFNEKWMPVSDVSCWMWIGAFHDVHGYGVLRANGRGILAHRLSWELHNGEIPEGLCVLHKCDTHWCVNPNHLFLGTRPDNAADMVSKGRQQRGERSGNAKLTSSDAESIKRSSNSAYKLAKQFNVSVRNIRSIQSGLTWKHLQ